MNAILFIAKKTFRGKKSDYSRNIVTISIGTIAICVTVMLLSIFIVFGFKHTIERKVIGFIGDVKIIPYTENESLETPPIELSLENLSIIRALPNVLSVSSYAYKAGIIKTTDKIEGIVVYGVSSDFDPKTFSGIMIDGYLPKYTETTTNDSVVISKVIADKLELAINDKIDVYFLKDETPRIRRFFVAGIYESGFNDYDEIYVLGDINHIRKLNSWEENDVTGYQIFLNSINNTDEFCNQASQYIDYKFEMKTYRELNPQVFDWLHLQNMNVALLITLMSVVCIITMISIMIISIIEKTSMIGILKSMGMNNRSIRLLFTIKSLYLTSIGLIIGDLATIVMSIMQQKFDLIKLSQESYYMSSVPVEINYSALILVNAAVIVCCILSMIIPSTLISRISPVNAIFSD